MYERLGEVELKSGERMEVGVVVAPDAEWRDRIVPFLGHKGEPYASHIRRSNETPLDGLETLFYVGHLDGTVITEVMIAGARGAGILGHVYTLPEHRRKGAYQAVMAAQTGDMDRRGFRLLSLGTGFDSPPYWIYHSFGFRGIEHGSGVMTWTGSDLAEAALFRPGEVTARDARWDDWGYFAWLGLLPVREAEELPRSRVARLRGRGLLEGPFVQLMLTREQAPELCARVLETEAGATVAWAILAPDLVPSERGGARAAPYPTCLPDAWTLDLHAHPAFADCLPALVAGLPWPDAPVAAAFTEPGGPKAAAMEAAGFRRAVSLPRWFRGEGGSRGDMTLWVRT